MSEPTITELNTKIAMLEAQNAQLKRARGVDWRNFWSWFFLTVSLLILIPAGLLVWLNRTVMDPQRYIQTVGPIIDEPAVQAAITAQASKALFSEVNVEQALSENLPERIQFLSAPLAGQVQGQLTKAIGSVVAGDKFHQVWIQVNQTAQQRFVEIAKEGRSPEIDINDAYSFLGSSLQGTRLEPLLNKDLPKKIGTVQVLDSPALAKIPTIVSKLDAWRWLLVVGSLLGAALAVMLARDRRRGLIRVGYMFIAAAILTGVLVRIANGVLMSKIADPVNKEAAQAIWLHLTQFLGVQLGVMAVFGLILAVFGWLLGDGRTAVRIRNRSSEFLADQRAQVFNGSDGRIPAINFMQSHRRSFEWALLALTVFAILVSIPLTVMSLLLIILVAVIALAALEFFAVPSVKHQHGPH